MSDISLRGWKVLSGEIMIQKSLNKIQKEKLPGSMWQYLQISEALPAAIQIHRSEFT